MTRVVIVTGAHEVQLECEGTGNSVMKLALQLWRETQTDADHATSTSVLGFHSELADQDDGDVNARLARG